MAKRSSTGRASQYARSPSEAFSAERAIFFPSANDGAAAAFGQRPAVPAELAGAAVGVTPHALLGGTLAPARNQKTDSPPLTD